MIELSYVEEVCLLNKRGKQCRYLSKIEGSANYFCLKKTGSKLLIDNIIKETKFNNKNYPVADNCPGKSNLKV